MVYFNMFKSKIILVDEDWKIIHEYKSRFKPSVGEFIYLEPRYFKVLAVIHVRPTIFPLQKNLTVVIKEHGNFYENN